jgi:putative ABC transport system ATP-binding protein
MQPHVVGRSHNHGEIFGVKLSQLDERTVLSLSLSCYPEHRLNIAQYVRKAPKNPAGTITLYESGGLSVILSIILRNLVRSLALSVQNGLIIETRDLVKSYFDGANAIYALRGANIKIYQGEMVAIMGPSGSGKSTLLYVLGLLHAPTSGVYMFKDHNVLEFSAEDQALFRNKEVGFVFQTCDLLPNSTVYENLELPLIYADAERRGRRKKILDALDKVGLSHRVDHWANRLSGGERQRAAVARALVNDPSLILGDEPTGQLDQTNTEAVVEQFRTIARQGYTVVLVTHEEEIGMACDRIIRIRDGSVVTDGLDNGEICLPTEDDELSDNTEQEGPNFPTVAFLGKRSSSASF